MAVSWHEWGLSDKQAEIALSRFLLADVHEDVAELLTKRACDVASFRNEDVRKVLTWMHEEVAAGRVLELLEQTASADGDCALTAARG